MMRLRPGSGLLAALSGLLAAPASRGAAPLASAAPRSAAPSKRVSPLKPEARRGVRQRDLIPEDSQRKAIATAKARRKAKGLKRLKAKANGGCN